MPRIVRQSLPQQIAQTIENQIAQGMYKVGDKLPTEPELIEMFAVSRNTLREAIQSLSHCGLVVTKQGDGTYVVAREKLQVDLFKLMDKGHYEDVLEVRELLEKYTVKACILRASDEDIAKIKACLDIRNQDLSVADFTRADVDFHIAIAEAAHNELLLSMYKYVSLYIQHSIISNAPDELCHITKLDALHTELYEAIKDRNEERALRCVSSIIES